MQSTAAINAQIYTYGLAFFEKVRAEVQTAGTWSSSLLEHEANRTKLQSTIVAVLEQAVARADLKHEDLWQIFWQRVVYAGTRASKGTEEIASMKSLVPLFQNLDHYDEDLFVFDKTEWNRFVKQCQARYGKTKWLRRAKGASDWNPQAAFIKTTPDVWKILVKDGSTYPGLKFSALVPKVEKYLKLAETLSRRRTQTKEPALNHYTGGYPFSTQHLTGQAWIEERQVLVKVRNLFAKEIGTMTAMHTMLDLGLKTIKPDRVMTYLFSQLGWLQTLPDYLSKDEVIKAYMQPAVIEEMTIRSDVLAHRLHHAGYLQAHRLLDIWIVKYGQEPEPTYGLTVNLQSTGRSIRGILDGVRPPLGSEMRIAEQEANQFWPCDEFQPVKISGSQSGGNRWRKFRKRQEE